MPGLYPSCPQGLALLLVSFSLQSDAAVLRNSLTVSAPTARDGRTEAQR